jgi:hypothetical protein
MTYPATPGHADTDTSRAAADSMEPHVTDLAAKVLEAINVSPKTCFEIETALGLSHQTASARIRELAMAGRVVDCGLRRRGPSGRNSIVWRPALPEDAPPVPEPGNRLRDQERMAADLQESEWIVMGRTTALKVADEMIERGWRKGRT